MALIKTDGGYRFESTGREIPEQLLRVYSKNRRIANLQPSEKKELAEYNIQQWAEWGGVESRERELCESLEMLLQLKKWKDRNGKDEHYLKLQPIAWERAKKLINPPAAGHIT